MPLACNSKRKLVQETDESNDDYSLRDSSDEGPFFSESEPSDMEEDTVQNNFEKKTDKNDTLMHQIGSFLLVKFRGLKINKFYVGKLLELTDGSGMLVKFGNLGRGIFFPGQT